MLTAVELAHDGGRVWFDRLGRALDCMTSSAPKPPVPPDENVLIDDTLPAGASLQSDNGAPLQWDSEHAASGSYSLTHPFLGLGVYGTRIAGLSHPLVSGAKLSVYALIDDCALPEQVRVSVTTTTGSRSVYWGQPVDGQPPTLLRMGGLPSEVGAWLRLELDLQALGLNGGTLTGVELGHVDGRVWFDRVAVWPVSHAVLTGFSSSHGRRIWPGTAVTWTATALGTVTPLQYRFHRRNAAGVWSEVQPYGTANTYTWTPAASDSGEGAVRVSVRNAGSLADFEDTRTLELIVGLGDSLLDTAPDGLRERWRRLLGRTTSRASLSLGVSQHLIEAQSVTPPRRVSLYTPELQLMAETAMTTTATPPVEYEYIWLAGQPLAQITTATNEVAYYFNDHLGTPILQTSSAEAVVWRIEREPYGKTFTTRTGADRHQPLAFPGQEEEGALSYNIYRWYRAGWGRYTQADPLDRPAFEYQYAVANPILYSDTLGLKATSGFIKKAPFWQKCIGKIPLVSKLSGPIAIVVSVFSADDIDQNGEAPKGCDSCPDAQPKPDDPPDNVKPFPKPSPIPPDGPCDNRWFKSVMWIQENIIDDSEANKMIEDANNAYKNCKAGLPTIFPGGM
jgi:RHS repeat-associated protein